MHTNVKFGNLMWLPT